MDVTPTIQHPHGRLRSITGTDPAAGAEISETVPDRRRWKILSIAITLTTDATVDDREVRLIIDDGTNTILIVRLTNKQAATNTYSYYFTNIGVAETKRINSILIPIPTLTLSPNSRIQTSTDKMKAGDNYAAPQLLLKEWIDP